MSPHGRRYGEKPSHPIYVWNGLLEAKHREKIGPALWEFLWCVDRITQERDGIGLVLGGQPVNFQKIADRFGVNEHTIRSHFEVLEAGGYIERVRTPRGYSVRVLNSAKFAQRKTPSDRHKTPDHNQGVIGTKPPITPPKIADHTAKNCRSNKSKQLSKQLEQAAAASPLYEVLALNPQFLPRDFQKFAGELFASHGDQTVLEAAGAIMDGWQALKNRIPAPFARAVARERERERQKAQPVKTQVPVREVVSLEVEL
jgi:DNA-binding FadR family transcriptional regulator